MPKIVSIDLLEPGIKLAEPITNSLGQTLINSGVELTAKHINILKTWNIHLVAVYSDDNDKRIEFTTSQLALAKEEIYRLITWRPRNNVEEELIELATIANSHLMWEGKDE